MEKDDEVKGNGNSYTTTWRQYDPRLGRWLSIDPEFKAFSWQSPYVSFDNNPIYFKDPRGLAAEGGEDDKTKKGDTFIGDDGKTYTASVDEFVVTPQSPPSQTNNLNSGDVINTPFGEIGIQDFSFFPDPTEPGISIEFNFKPSNGDVNLNQENSRFRWVQTVRSNFDIDAQFKSDNPIGTEVQFLDISDRHERESSINYNSSGISINDILGRPPLKNQNVNWQAETSLIKIDDAGNIEKRIITLTWGFTVFPNGSSLTTGLKQVDAPSNFHIKVLNNNPAILKEIIQ